MFFMHDSPHPVKHKITVETVRKPQVLCNEIRNFVSRVTETYAHAWCTSPLQSCRKVQNVAGNMTDRRQKLYSKTSQYASFTIAFAPRKPDSVLDPEVRDRNYDAGTCLSQTSESWMSWSSIWLKCAIRNQSGMSMSSGNEQTETCCISQGRVTTPIRRGEQLNFVHV